MESCAEILRQFTHASSFIDNAAQASYNASAVEDASRLFMQSGDELDELGKIVKARVAVSGMNSFQLTDVIPD